LFFCRIFFLNNAKISLAYLGQFFPNQKDFLFDGERSSHHWSGMDFKKLVNEWDIFFSIENSIITIDNNHIGDI